MAPKSPTVAARVRVSSSANSNDSFESSPKEFDILRNNLRSMVGDIHTKLDKVILNQESLRKRVGIVEVKQIETENALTFTCDSVDELQQQVITSTGSLSKMELQLQEAVKRIEKMENDVLQQERYSRSSTCDSVVSLNNNLNNLHML